MLPSLLASLSFVSVIITTYILTNQTQKLNQKFKSSFASLIDDINRNQKIEYNFDKKQFNSTKALNSNVNDIRHTYESKNDLAKNVRSSNIVGEYISSGNYDVYKNIGFYNTYPESSPSMDYTMGRGSSKISKDKLVINIPENSNSGFNINTSGGNPLLSIDGLKGNLNVSGDIYNNGNSYIKQDITANNAKLIGNLNALGITLAKNGYIKGDSVMTISNNDKLNLLTKNGVIVGQEEGTNGNLRVEGDVVIKGNTQTQNLNNMGMLMANGGITVPHTITISSADPGEMIEKQYGNFKGNRYGMGQFPNGFQRMYAASNYDQSSINLSLANDDGSFDDILNISHKNNNKMLKFGGNGKTMSWTKNNSNNFIIKSDDPSNQIKFQNGDNTGIILSNNTLGIGTQPLYAPLDIAGNLSVRGTDIQLNQGDTSRGNSSTGRALVKDTGNQLTLNYNNDFDGGIQMASKTNFKGPIYLNDNPISLRNDSNHGIKYDKTQDGPNIYGYGGGKLSSTNGNTAMSWCNDSSVYVGNTKFSQNYTGYPDTGNNYSEIANDTNKYKQLMIVGNKSGGGDKKVNISDSLTVNKNLYTLDDARFQKNIKLNSNSSIVGDGILYLSSGDLINIQPKNGVNITNDNGNGSLHVQGDVLTNNRFCINNTCLTEAQLNNIKKNNNS